MKELLSSRVSSHRCLIGLFVWRLLGWRPTMENQKTCEGLSTGFQDSRGRWMELRGSNWEVEIVLAGRGTRVTRFKTRGGLLLSVFPQVGDRVWAPVRALTSTYSAPRGGYSPEMGHDRSVRCLMRGLDRRCCKIRGSEFLAVSV